MPDNLKILDLRLGYVSKALHTTAESARDHAVRNVARQHLELIQYYRDGFRTGEILMTSGFADPDFNTMIDFSERARLQAKRRQWRALLGNSRALIMALPGDPPSLPKKPPRPPWRRKP